MPRIYSARTVLSTLQRAGFTIVSQRGSHNKLLRSKLRSIPQADKFDSRNSYEELQARIKLFKRDNNNSFTVIVPTHKEIAIGTFGSILKQAGMTRKEFEESIR